MRIVLNLRQRFSLTVLIAIALSSSIMMITIYWAVSNYTREYTLHYWQEYTQTFADSAKFSIALASPDKANEIASHFKTKQMVEKAAVYTQSMQPLTAIGNHTACLQTSDNNDGTVLPSRFQNPFFDELTTSWCFYAPVYYSPSPSTAYLEPDQPNPATNIWIGFVELVISKQALNHVIKKILWLSIICVAVFEWVIFISVRYFSDVLTRALLELAEVMKKTGEGKRGVRAEIPGPPDIAALKQRLNQMLDQIEGHEELLETQVATRTAELQTALDSALSASRYKSKIISMVSHEMKSPLHAVMGYSQLAIEALDNSSPSETKQFLLKGLDSAHNLEAQINQILDYARLESGNAQTHYSNVSLRHLVNQCVDKIAPLCEHSGNTLQINGTDMIITTDQDKLQHILMNLLSNANKFTHNGHITLDWRTQQNQLILRVSDTGCGIDDTDLEKIFQPFWQADMSLSRPAGGSGLGLAIVKLYTTLLDGEIDVTSSPAGSCFSVVIPIATA
jgi:signal transduction histidine kinase